MLLNQMIDTTVIRCAVHGDYDGKGYPKLGKLLVELQEKTCLVENEPLCVTC